MDKENVVYMHNGMIRNETVSFADEWLDLKLSCEWFKVMNILKMKLKWGVGLKAIEREMKK